MTDAEKTFNTILQHEYIYFFRMASQLHDWELEAPLIDLFFTTGKLRKGKNF